MPRVTRDGRKCRYFRIFLSCGEPIAGTYFDCKYCRNEKENILSDVLEHCRRYIRGHSNCVGLDYTFQVGTSRPRDIVKSRLWIFVHRTTPCQREHRLRRTNRRRKKRKQYGVYRNNGASDNSSPEEETDGTEEEDDNAASEGGED